VPRIVQWLVSQDKIAGPKIARFSAREGGPGCPPVARPAASSGPREDNRDGPGRTPRGQGRGRTHRGDHVNLQTDQLRRKIGEPIKLSLRPSVFENNIAPLDIAELP
jgi:hypothetical protein